MKEEIIQILNVTRQELVDIIKEGVKLELNRQRSIGNPLNRLSITGEDTVYLTRNEVSKVLNVTVQTLNNWRREGVLVPLKIGGRVLYKKEDVYNNSRLVA
jgi:excisionase family DNA binding protein